MILLHIITFEVKIYYEYAIGNPSLTTLDKQNPFLQKIRRFSLRNFIAVQNTYVAMCSC